MIGSIDQASVSNPFRVPVAVDLAVILLMVQYEIQIS